MNRKINLAVMVAIALGVPGIIFSTSIPVRAAEIVTETTKTQTVEAAPLAAKQTLVETRERTETTDTVTKNLVMAKSSKACVHKAAAKPIRKVALKRTAFRSIRSSNLAFRPMITETHKTVTERTSLYQPMALLEKPAVIEKTTLVEKACEAPALIEKTKLIEAPATTTIIEKPLVLERPALVKTKVIEACPATTLIEAPATTKVIEKPLIIQYKPSLWDRFWNF